MVRYAGTPATSHRVSTGNIGEKFTPLRFPLAYRNPSINSLERNHAIMDTPQQVAIPVLTDFPATADLDFTKFSVDNRKSFVVGYNPKVGEMPGYRHAVIRYRVTGSNKVDKPAKMVTIPQIALDADNYLLPSAAATVLLGVLEDQQDGMIRDLLEANKQTIEWDDVSLDKTLAALTATRISNRLTREMIELWADVAIKAHTDARAQAIVNQKATAGVTVSLATQQAATFTTYKDNLAKLSAAVPNVGQDTATSLQTFLTNSKLDDDIAKVLLKKLHAILNPVAASVDL